MRHEVYVWVALLLLLVAVAPAYANDPKKAEQPKREQPKKEQPKGLNPADAPQPAPQPAQPPAPQADTGGAVATPPTPGGGDAAAADAQKKKKEQQQQPKRLSYFTKEVAEAVAKVPDAGQRKVHDALAGKTLKDPLTPEERALAEKLQSELPKQEAAFEQLPAKKEQQPATKKEQKPGDKKETDKKEDPAKKDEKKTQEDKKDDKSAKKEQKPGDKKEDKKDEKPGKKEQKPGDKKDNKGQTDKTGKKEQQQKQACPPSAPLSEKASNVVKAKELATSLKTATSMREAFKVLGEAKWLDQTLCVASNGKDKCEYDPLGALKKDHYINLVDPNPPACSPCYAAVGCIVNTLMNCVASANLLGKLTNVNAPTETQKWDKLNETLTAAKGAKTHQLIRGSLSLQKGGCENGDEGKPFPYTHDFFLEVISDGKGKDNVHSYTGYTGRYTVAQWFSYTGSTPMGYVGSSTSIDKFIELAGDIAKGGLTGEDAWKKLFFMHTSPKGCSSAPGGFGDLRFTVAADFKMDDFLGKLTAAVQDTGAMSHNDKYGGDMLRLGSLIVAAA